MRLLPAILSLLLCSVSCGLRAQPVLVDDSTAITALAQTIADRLMVMPEVAAGKWNQRLPLVDSAREMAVIDAAAAQAQAIGLSDVAVRELMAAQIRIARAVQQQLHDEWRLRGCNACRDAHPLTVLRGRLDDITRAQLRAVYLAVPALRRPESVAPLESALERCCGATPGFARERERLIATLGAMHRVQAPGLARIRDSGILRIATTGDYAPFSLLQDGSLSGTDIDRSTALATSLGVDPVFVPTSWPTLLDDLRADRFDVAISGISITSERASLGLFSTPYHVGGKTILARCRKSRRFDTLKELNRPRVRVIVNPGGTNERFVREHLPAATIIVHADNRTIFAELIARRADAMITDDIEADLQSRLHPELCRVLPGTLNRVEKAVFMIDDPALKSAIDAWLTTQEP
jgi:cyclohexadienyl dehydratase